MNMNVKSYRVTSGADASVQCTGVQYRVQVYKWLFSLLTHFLSLLLNEILPDNVRLYKREEVALIVKTKNLCRFVQPKDITVENRLVVKTFNNS